MKVRRAAVEALAGQQDEARQVAAAHGAVAAVARAEVLLGERDLGHVHHSRREQHGARELPWVERGRRLSIRDAVARALAVAGTT